MKPHLPVLALAALGVACAVGATACEIPLIIILATGEDVETTPPIEDNFCRQAFLETTRLTGRTGTVGLNAESQPVSPLAEGDVYDWFFTSPKFAPISSIQIEGKGAFETTGQDRNTCSWIDDQQAIGAQLVASDSGTGTIEVTLDGALADTFEFEVAPVAALTLEWRQLSHRGRAVLTDAEGRSLNAFYGLTWEVVPNRGTIQANAVGPDGPEIIFDGSTLELELYVYFGSLFQHMTLEADPDTGIYTPKTDMPNPASASSTGGSGGFGTGGFGTGGFGTGGSGAGGN